ncbi:MAG: FtsQ-type POTRA domain-containing protein [Patescibacteria group bacterium]
MGNILIVAALIVFLWWLFLSSSFVVRDIIIEGNNLVTTEKISSIVPKDKNIFIVNTGNIEKKIKQNIPEINDVQIYKGFPDALKIVVVEFDQAIVWKTGDKFYLLDSQGRAYKDVTADISSFSNLPIIEDAQKLPVDLQKQIVSPSFVAFSLNIYKNIAEMANLHPDRFVISETTFDLNLYTKEGAMIKFDSTRSSNKQLNDLKAVMIQGAGNINEYVDLRVDGWAYYK